MKERPFSVDANELRRVWLGILLGLTALVASGRAAHGQNAAGADAGGGCTLKNHVYHCDGEVFARALLAAETVRIETHDVDGPAQSQLKSLLTKKLGKKVLIDESSPADLAFLLIPTTVEGIVNSPGNADLGTLRVYTVGKDGGWGRLLWAETYSGQQDLPWPAVVHGLILQFEKDFQIK